MNTGMIKVLFSLTLALCPLVGITADSIFTKTGVTYKIVSDSTVTIIAQKGNGTYTDSLLTIPAEVKYNGKSYLVKCIEEEAFAACGGIKSVIICNGIERIRDKAFVGCANLESVFVPGSIKSIGDNVFAYCVNLTSIVVDHHNPFFDSRNGCNAIIRTKDNTLLCACNSTVIPSSVEAINGYAYTGLIINSIDFPIGLTKISRHSICDCQRLEKINISSSVDCVEPEAILFCNNLKSITIDCNNKIYDSRKGCNAIVQTDSEKLILGCSTTTIPAGITEIGEGAFRFCENLQELIVPEGVEMIGRNAFWGCTSLRRIKLPTSLLSFEGFSHFAYCTSLDSVYIPQYVDSVPSDIFMGCISLEKVIVDRKNPKYDSRNNCNAIIRTINNRLVAGCKKTTIVDGIQSISEYALAKTGITSIHIPASVEYIDSMAFRENEYCKVITVDKGNQRYKSGGDNSIIERFSNKLVLACSTTSVSSEVTSIGGYAFLNTPTNLIIPSGVKYISSNAFINCQDLETVFVPASVERIERLAFCNCKKLSNVVLMGNHTDIDKNAFVGCDCLKLM